MDRDRGPYELKRREVIRGVGAAGLVSLPIIACAQEPPAARATGRLIAGETCAVTPEQTEGPFYFDPRLVRQDIKEGRPGIPLRIRLQVVDAAQCTPGGRARVDIWHCDAAGAYSGYDQERTAGETWLRGTQIADADGVVAFDTLYPGWYQGRATHIHCKAWLPDGREVTSQLYFPEELNERVFQESAYGGRRGRRVRNEEDGIFREAGENVPIAQVRPLEGGGYDGAVVLALR